jgi:hypothetical protein
MLPKEIVVEQPWLKLSCTLGEGVLTITGMSASLPSADLLIN